MSWIIKASPVLKIFEPLKLHQNGENYIACIIRNRGGKGDYIVAGTDGSLDTVDNQMLVGALQQHLPAGEDFDLQDLKMDPQGWEPVKAAGGDGWGEMKALHAQMPIWGRNVSFTYNAEGSPVPVAGEQ